ncbi:MAG: SRPBCC domain-containing protein [Planctomycetota bacterium]
MAREKRLVKVREYGYPPEVVWTALTDAHALAEWLMPNDFKAERGARFRFMYDAMPGCAHGRTDCEVLEIERPRTMTWSWQNAKPDGSPVGGAMRVRFDLEPIGLANTSPGTRLTLTQTGCEHISMLTRFMMSHGWTHMLKRLIPRVLSNVDGAGVFTPGAIPLDKRCYKTRTIPEELVR